MVSDIDEECDCMECRTCAHIATQLINNVIVGLYGDQAIKIIAPVVAYMARHAVLQGISLQKFNRDFSTVVLYNMQRMADADTKERDIPTTKGFDFRTMVSRHAK